jgi:hypothetical protein
MRSYLAVVALVAVIAVASGQSTSNTTDVGPDKIDTMRKLEANAVPLDTLPKSTVYQPTHEKTDAELLAEDPDSVFVGRSAESVC